MSADTQSLLQKYSTPSEAPAANADLYNNVLNMQKPKWGQFQSTAKYEQVLSRLTPGVVTQDFSQESVAACLAALSVEDAAPLQYILTILYDILRNDSSSYQFFDEALKQDSNVCRPFVTLLERHSADPQWTYVGDKSAWIITAILGHAQKPASGEPTKALLTLLLQGQSCTELGLIEAITNLLKSTYLREAVWTHPGVTSVIFKMSAKTSPSPILYKSVFAIWMASFDKNLSQSLRDCLVTEKLKDILIHSRTEKVIRLCLTVLKNFLTKKSDYKEICEDIVEEGLLEAVSQLEYEKWRDADIYDDIKEVVQLVSSAVSECSNFDRYMKELESGNLSWGFIHSNKFFGENVMKFETGEFKAIKMLAHLLSHENPTTLAVACHDIGQFVSLHPLGKKQVARLGIKERIMELMGSTEPEKRDVRREALLCCQKIMLNKWQDVSGEKK